MSIHINEAISPVVIKAVQGDITDIETDAMVNSVNTAMVMGGKSSVASRINELTEGRLESILSNEDKYPKPVPLGEVCVTESDELPCSFVFHLSTHGDLIEMVNAANKFGYEEELPDRLQIVLLDTIKLGVENLLWECEERHLKRMSIPLIGSGSLNLPKLLAVEVLVGALSSQLLEKTPEYLREIKIITPEKSSFDFIEGYLENLELNVSSNNGPDNMSENPPSLPLKGGRLWKPDDLDLHQLEKELPITQNSMMLNKSPTSSLNYSFKWKIDLLDVGGQSREELVEQIKSKCEEEGLSSEKAEALLDKIGLVQEARKVKVEEPESSQSIAFEAMGEISSLKSKQRRLEKENQEFREEIKILSERNRKLEPEKHLANHNILDREEAWQRNDLPLPLGYARDILSAEEDPNSRLLNSITAIGIVNKYFSSLVLAEYRAAGFFDETINQNLQDRFSRPITDGSWRWIGGTIARAFNDEGRNGKVIVDFVKQWLNEDGSWSRFPQVLLDLINLRNEIHDPINADDARARDWLALFNPLWEEMCKLSAGLLNYELVFIDTILQNLPDERCKYAVKHLKGGVLVPQSGTLDLKNTYNPGELLLWDPVNEGMLELSPFIVYEYSQRTNSRETFCLDLIQHTQFQFRAFRYAHRYNMNFEGTTLFSSQQ